LSAEGRRPWRVTIGALRVLSPPGLALANVLIAEARRAETEFCR
jgi:hypothetical protein